MPETMTFDYFFGEESSQFSFFRIPRQLISSPRFKAVSTDAKLLYGMMLDRMGLSARNGWYDKLGRVYIYYTVDEIREDLNCGNDKAVKLLAELDTAKGVGLIERVKQGQGKPTIIYVKKFTSQAVPLPEESQDAPLSNEGRCSDIGFSEVQTSDFPKSRDRECRSPEIGKTEANYNDLNKTDTSYTYPSTRRQSMGLMDRLECQSEIEEQIDVDLLREMYPAEDVDGIASLLADTVCSSAPTLKIGGQEIDAEQVRRRYRELDHSHIEYVLDCLKSNTTKIHNIRAYLLTALYNAPVTIGHFYAAEVRHDLK